MVATVIFNDTSIIERLNHQEKLFKLVIKMLLKLIVDLYI